MTIEIAGMAPLIQVYDMAEALRFYRDALGFELVSASEEVDTPEGHFFHWCWLKLGNAHLMLNTAYDEGERPLQRDPTRQAAHGDTGLFFDCPNPDAVAEYLRGRGVTVSGPKDAPYGLRQLWMRDPDGYEVCFQAPVQ